MERNNSTALPGAAVPAYHVGKPHYFLVAPPSHESPVLAAVCRDCGAKRTYPRQLENEWQTFVPLAFDGRDVAADRRQQKRDRWSP